ncbi:GDSL-like Lipase/Acylhydrolase family protein [Lyngbya aestuarii BL J]|uniref:GDSL-like Lipase/Acylhydrolase family protein n=1 Tax=Lyngbya aestuarii BL J TaxID=1348334 RepID=U7QHF0_9CYAN|nr:lipase/acylhydrolase [Lyngbya aestuarii]ERT06480.1 GDSL-like Lipase/Acylhydrolase family protein [Lyngbya aestuarii BL J]
MLKLLKSLSFKQIRQTLILLFCWTVVPLVLVEVLMIVLEPYLFKGLYQYDQDLGFKIRPYANGNNQFGFNDKDYPLEREAGKFRMLVVSDSFNWAGGKEENYTTLLENQFTEYYGIDQVEVINTGYPGTHTGEQLEMLKKFGLQYHPDLVVLGFFVGNDFIDADPHRKRIIVNDIYIDIDKREELVIFGYPIIGQSRLWLFIQQKYKIFQEAAKSQQALESGETLIASSTPQLVTQNYNSTVEQSPGILSLETFLEVEKSRLSFCRKHDLAEGERDKNINYILNAISEMNRILQEKNIQFVVAIYPDEFQVNPKLFNQIIEEFNLKPEKYQVTCMQDILKQHLEAENIAYIDFLERFKAEQKKQHLYLLQEPHWNSAGNQLAADILFDNLRPKTDNYFQSLVKPSASK